VVARCISPSPGTKPMARSDWGGRTVGHPPRKWLNLRGRGCPSRAESHSRRHPRESRWSSIGWSPMIFLRPAPAAKTRPVAASCVASSHAAFGPSTPRWEYHQEWGWLPVSVLAGVERAVVHTICGYLRLCMPRCMHKLGSAPIKTTPKVGIAQQFNSADDFIKL
jgi:hypothetical protein